MIESKLNLKRIAGIVLIVIGLSGFSYLLWVYVIWSNTLPVFPSESISDIFGTQSVYANSGGFGDLLANNTGEDVEPLYRLPVEQKGVVKGLQDKNNDGISITIPRLGITDARIALDVNGQDEKIYDSVLTQSIAHLANSAYPGQEGNTFLFGHSMLPLLASNNYESIFTNLPQMKAGDVVSIAMDNHIYTYEITHTGVVEPSDVFIMNQPKNKHMITLMTCIPPGFANQRYIAVGNLIEVK
ncbi:sortase [bacterium]|uniref:Sortase n=2 Tax=Katanobacteria TaxID=422282 RepID=A0A2M7X2G1_UNCKA|nr:sortase [bacterium]PIP56526.1 MAG: hypothetical protein COX05_02545 [candidate division WWE3 bacterium CG22_combo_CG10-13_8_21_14_all_39_12]PJA40354.1 MAG: hypothetical protein CO179_02515 [candidate division WWE3 bacterium CG_4_9_14_3_um_filter_39_7]